MAIMITKGILMKDSLIRLGLQKNKQKYNMFWMNIIKLESIEFLRT